jgi:peptidyl-Lys metalloendopeptidase
LKVSATLSNTGDENIKLLNDPRTLLSTLPTNAFGIVHEDSGASPSFVGAAVKYVPEVAVKIGGAGAFTTLAPGASVTIVHDRKFCSILAWMA